MESRELTTEHQRLAEIIEMIHTASLIHDDVIDDSGMRRGTYDCYFEQVHDTVWFVHVATSLSPYIPRMEINKDVLFCFFIVISKFAVD